VRHDQELSGTLAVRKIMSGLEGPRPAEIRSVPRDVGEFELGRAFGDLFGVAG